MSYGTLIAKIPSIVKTIQHVVQTVNYKEYVALLSQAGTNNPTAIVQNNTLGVVTFVRTASGMYDVYLDGEPINNEQVFNPLKINVFISPINHNNFTSFAKGGQIITRNAESVAEDDILYYSSYAIKIYN